MSQNFPVISQTKSAALVPKERLERVWSWGMADSSMSYVFRPTTIEGIREAFEYAIATGLKVGLRGAGRSYGDASLNSEQICLDLTRMNRILEWNPSTGIIDLEPGVTLQQLWQYTIEDGWWPPVVSGTMYTTIGGTAAMNIHGKNNFCVGPMGEHIQDFDIILPTGEMLTCSKEANQDIFYAAIGGFGMLGCFTRIRLALKKVHSGNLVVEPISIPNLETMVSELEVRRTGADYLVGWVDCFASGPALGRGVVHQANYISPGADQNAAQSLRVSNQELPDTFFFGIMPKSIMWRPMWMMLHNPGMRFTNWAKYHSSRLLGNHAKHVQSHAGFAFLLDYVPNWKWAYKPGGLIQYQSFVPVESAENVFRQQLVLQHKMGIVSYLGVIKRHRPDPFLMTHGLDGYSLALDFKISRSNRAAIWKLAKEMDRIVVEASGRFYFAKDSTLSPESLGQFMQEPRVRQFLSIRKRCDPNSLLQTNLYRRLFTDFKDLPSADNSAISNT